MWNIIYKYGNLIESDSMATLYGAVMENSLSRGVNDKESLRENWGKSFLDREQPVQRPCWGLSCISPKSYVEVLTPIMAVFGVRK